MHTPNETKAAVFKKILYKIFVNIESRALPSIDERQSMPTLTILICWYVTMYSMASHVVLVFRTLVEQQLMQCKSMQRSILFPARRQIAKRGKR